MNYTANGSFVSKNYQKKSDECDECDKSEIADYLLYKEKPVISEFGKITGFIFCLLQTNPN